MQQDSDLLRAADFFLLPSTHEGLPLSILEAQASGVPVLAAPTAGVPEVVTDGETGFLVPIRSSAALAEKINWCAVNRSVVDGMGIAASKRAGEFTWRAYGEKIVASVSALTCQ